MGVLAGIVIYIGILFLNGALISQSQSGEFYAYSVGRPMAHTSGRSMFWRLSVEDAIKHPVLGTGPTRYACDSDIILPAAHPHSFLFRIMGEWGFIAILLTVVIGVSIGVGFLKDLKYRNITSNNNLPLRTMLAISLMAGIIHACLSGLLIMPASQIAMILIGGWVLGLTGSTWKKRQSFFIENSLLLLGVILAASLFLFSASEIPRLHERTKDLVNYGPMVPRFWQDGRICEYSY